jgi:hypothetical protein
MPLVLLIRAAITLETLIFALICKIEERDVVLNVEIFESYAASSLRQQTNKHHPIVIRSGVCLTNSGDPNPSTALHQYNPDETSPRPSLASH